MDIEVTIEEFLAFALSEETALEDYGDLIAHLDRLAIAINSIKYTFDETEYPEAPKISYKEIRKKIEQRFPKLGLYNTPQDISEHLLESQIVVGDAVDDLSDIVGDLIDASWCFESTSKNNALWHLEIGFRSHWGRHLRNLQLFLHDVWW